MQLPPDYCAFITTYRPIYLQYAKVRLKCEATSQLAVADALGKLAAKWPLALSSPNLPAAAWSILTGHLGASGQPNDPLRSLLSDQQADVVILRHRLGLGIRDVAHIMGLSQPMIIGQLRQARKLLQHLAITR
ncbi:hypothetical protein ACWEQ8_43975 [Streptomyces noursei]